MVTNKMPGKFTSRLIRIAGDVISSRGIGKGRFCVINYHRILECHDPLVDYEPDVNTFRWEMEFLANCFNVIPLHDAIKLMQTGVMPPRAVCITFDDGYRSTHDIALPILRELNLTATVFIATGFIGEGNMWNDRIIEAVRQLPCGQYDLRDINLGIYDIQTLQDRKGAIQQLTEKSKYIQANARLELANRLEKYAGSDFSNSVMLTPEMIMSLVQSGIEIGGHTITHPILTSLADHNAKYEIAECKQKLEALTGKPVNLFAYPNGKVGMDFDKRHVKMAKEAGYTAAFTTAIGAASNKFNLYQLPRSRPWDTTPLLFGLRILSWLAR
jgi:peptidoglycan/xylan/chitin deacetylase (PgdA/CDA1 family)